MVHLKTSPLRSSRVRFGVIQALQSRGECPRQSAFYNLLKNKVSWNINKVDIGSVLNVINCIQCTYI
jgi:hypothetical protein